MNSKTYETPKLARHGRFNELTQAADCPGALDDAFPVGTPTEDLTCFS